MICDVIAGAWGKKFNAVSHKPTLHQFNSIQSVPVSFDLWDTALKFLSPGPLSDVSDHLVAVRPISLAFNFKCCSILLILIYTKIRLFLAAVCSSSLARIVR